MADWTTGTCKANGIDVHYLRTGGNKPPVVLLHGLMLNGACWTPLARALEKDCDVIMPYDQPDRFLAVVQTFLRSVSA